MPIPSFDLNGVLPPHLGNPTKSTEVSPYKTDILQFCQTFGNTPARVAILDGFVKLRRAFLAAGLKQGFQLLDGSFLEDIERTEGRNPNDLDVATFYWSFGFQEMQNLIQSVPELIDIVKLKQTYLVDHYFLDAGFHPQTTVEMSQYWYGLFSHTRNRLWKGMLRIELDTPNEDAQASLLLSQRSASAVATP